MAQAITGQTPGLWGGDFLFSPADVANRTTMVDEAIRQSRAGSIVALTWHMCPPTIGSTCGWDEAGILGSLSDAQWTELVTNGTNLNNRWKARLDEVVPHLQRLEDAGVEALWRPIHEMNEGWSWWGGRPGSTGSRRLYEITYDYLVGVKGLTNLVWVWNVKDVAMGSIGQYFPRGDTVEVASLDVWVKLEPSGSDYQAMLAVAGGRPIALAEVGRTPSPAILDSQPRWAWFMVWAEWLTDPAYNTNAGVQATYFHPRTLNRGEFTVGGAGPAGRQPRAGPADPRLQPGERLPRAGERGRRQRRHPLEQRLGGPAVDLRRPGHEPAGHRRHAALGGGVRPRVPDPDLDQRHELDHRPQ